ncbi:error-prone DNA polymerase [Pleionea sediminis]|uniref:error-prone DNA polymerase n=1 Tax=Pleionea sediminis TaxID=2569479 RepID=UPI0011858DF6|nr:error-prone DNA polymerase [Pleionea sediminis]
MKYYELFCQSNFSFLVGASHPEELVYKAKEQGYSGLAITDECSFAGCVRAHVTAKKVKIHLIIGSFFRVNLETEKDMEVILLCPNKAAYSEVSQLITRTRRRTEKGKYQMRMSDLDGYIENALAIWLPPKTEHQQKSQLFHLMKIFNGRLWIGYERLLKHDDFIRYQQCIELSQQYKVPIVAQNRVLMHSSERLSLQHCLTAIKHNQPVQHLGTQLISNGEQTLRCIEQLNDLYPYELLKETEYIARRCHFEMGELKYHYPNEVIPEGLLPINYLRELCLTGAKKRWPEGPSEKTLSTLKKELKLIRELSYEHYFLTVYDIVAFARREGILCQGRGSAANSVVCYCLFITEVDPEQSDLLFERFISKERDEPPDIDVDFEHQRREEVIQYIYKKYSRERAAIAATVITYRMKSAIRDVGKALDIDESIIDYLSKSLAWWDKPDKLKEYFQSRRLSNTALLAKHYHKLVMDILGFPRHLSQHVGGFVITNQPIASLVPVENASMPDRTVIQWDKYDIEALQLLKIDVLGLGMLTMIRKALELTQCYSSIKTLSDIPKEDAATYRMLCNGDSVGVFQVESRAQMSMLPRLKPKTFYDLVIEIAIVRPGPIQGDMVHPYLRRRDGLESTEYPNEAIKSVLDRTLGVPIFQEQVIQLAMVAAGFSGGEADQLRRAMASWGRNGDLYKFKDNLINGMLINGYSKDYANRVFEQMKGFGSYGFPESHSASFAILAYFSAWLKRHHSAAFYCALLNSHPMGFYSPSQLIQDARRHNILVYPIDVDHSEWASTLEIIDQGKLTHSSERIEYPHNRLAIRLGLHLVKGFNAKAAERLVNERKKNAFINLQDLVNRAQLNKIEREALVKADALKRIAKHRYQGQWQVLALEEKKPLLDEVDRQTSNSLDEDIELLPPQEVDNLLMDYQTTGLTLNRHPLAILREKAPVADCKRALDLRTLHQGQFVKIAGVVTCRQRPGTAAGVLFLTLEDETGNINVIVWKDKVEKFRKAIMGSRLLLIKGTIERERKVVHVVAGYVEDISGQLPHFRRVSRDFH